MLIVDEGLTAEQFRADPELRQALDTFLKSKPGALMFFILNEGSQPVHKIIPDLPQNRLEELHASEHRGNLGHRRCVNLLKSLAQIPATEDKSKKGEPHRLGTKAPQDVLDAKIPKFEIPATETTTPPTT